MEQSLLLALESLRLCLADMGHGSEWRDLAYTTLIDQRVAGLIKYGANVEVRGKFDNCNLSAAIEVQTPPYVNSYCKVELSISIPELRPRPWFYEAWVENGQLRVRPLRVIRVCHAGSQVTAFRDDNLVSEKDLAGYGFEGSSNEALGQLLCRLADELGIRIIRRSKEEEAK